MRARTEKKTRHQEVDDSFMSLLFAQPVMACNAADLPDPPRRINIRQE